MRSIDGRQAEGFVTRAAVLHLIRPSWGRMVPEAVFAGVRPGVWVSEALGSQRGHAERWQMCLAHLLRDAQWHTQHRRGTRARSCVAASAAAGST